MTTVRTKAVRDASGRQEHRAVDEATHDAHFDQERPSFRTRRQSVERELPEEDWEEREERGYDEYF